MTSPAAPYLSVVVAARNDDHGGNPLYRTQLFVDGLAAQCDRFGLDAELVIVEWNPPADRPRLAEVIDWPASDGRLGVRIIEVPHELHARLAHADKLPLFQMIAKNVGIRRARGQFVLATNIDILLSDGVMETIARRDLRTRRVYRADRHDVPAEIDPAWDLDRQLAWCRDHVLRIHGEKGTLVVATGEFDRVAHDTPRLLRRWWALAERVPWLAEAGTSLPLWRLVETVASQLAGGRFTHAGRPPLHTNASGDFTLLSRNGWLDVGGYLELELLPGHIDSLFMIQSFYAGYRQVCLPAPAYHIEHGGSFWLEVRHEEGQAAAAPAAEVPRFSDADLDDFYDHMRRHRRPAFPNPPGWGLAGVDLAERTVPLPRRPAPGGPGREEGPA